MSEVAEVRSGEAVEERTTFTVARDAALMTALLLSFAGQAFPYGVPLYLPCVAVAFVLAALCAMWRDGIGRISLGRSAFPLLVTLAMLFFLYGLVLTVTWDKSLLSEVLNGFAVLLLWIAVANRPLDQSRLYLIVRRFMTLLMLLATVLAILGLVKFALLLHGQKLSFVEHGASGAYPWGTSLTQDYNMFALTILAGMLAAAKWITEARGLLGRLAASLLLLMLTTVGFLSGSRRFWVVAPLALSLLFVASGRESHTKNVIRNLGVLLFCAGLLVFVAYQFGPDDWKSLATTGWNLQRRLASVLDGGQGGGLDSRTIRWDFAFSLLTDWRIWTGSGFDYLDIFGCHFGGCLSGEYPHNPLISALLYGGIAGMLSVLALTLYLVYCSLRLLFGAPSNPFLGALLIAHLPIALISSNGPFAIKSLLATGLLCAWYLSVCRPFDNKTGVRPMDAAGPAVTQG